MVYGLGGQYAIRLPYSWQSGYKGAQHGLILIAIVRN